MIKILYNKDLKEVYYKLYNCLYFDDVKSVYKQYGIVYDTENKVGVSKPKTFLDCEKALRDIDKLLVSETDYQAIQACLIAPADIKIFRKTIHPENWKFKPLDTYQTDAIKFMITHEAGILGLPCGSGKSYVYDNAIDELFLDKSVEQFLIISTRAGLYNWRREILKFSHLTEADIQIVCNEDNRKIFDVYSDKKVIITDYDTFKMTSEHYTALDSLSKKALKALEATNKKKAKQVRDSTKIRKSRIDLSKWSPNNKNCIILDEIHKIKNNSGRSAHILAIAPKFSRRYGGSGTLLPRDFTDSYNLAKFMHPSIYYDYSRSEWEKEFCLYNNPNQKHSITGYDEEKLNFYKERFYKYVFFRTEEQCFAGKLPEYFPKKIYIPMSNVMQQLYDDIAVKKFQKIEDENLYLRVKKTMNVFPYLMLMLSDISLIKQADIIKDNEKLFSKWKITDNPKYDIMTSIIEDHLEEDPTCRFAVGSYHPAVLDQLASNCKYKYMVLHGENTKGKDKDKLRDEAIEAFKKDDSIKVLFLQPAIFNDSINITQVNVQIEFDNCFEFDKVYQFSRRFFRTGQKKKTYKYSLIYDKSFEIMQQAVLDGRFNLNNISNNFEQLTMEEWKGLKNGDEGLIDLFLDKIKEKNKC